MEVATDKETIALALIFNEDGNVLTIPDGNGFRLPSVNVPPDTDYKDLMELLKNEVKLKLMVNVGLGDLVFDNYAEDGTPVMAFMVFLESYDVEGEWCSINSIEHGIDDTLMTNMRLHLTNTLFNPMIMRMGNCYENLDTGEAYYVIHIINDRKNNKRFLVLESTMATEPIILPSDAFWGLTMKWITHMRFAKVSQHTPEGLAERAKHFFITAHNMTNHRYDGKPYSYHLSKAVEKFHKYKHLIPVEDHERVESEMWGHDSIEDARLTFNNIKEEFDESMAEGCYAMTNEKGRNRKERSNDKYYAGLEVDKYGEFKKLCDRMANAEESVKNGHSMLGAHKKELADFEKQLRTNGDQYKEMWDDLKALLG